MTVDGDLDISLDDVDALVVVEVVSEPRRVDDKTPAKSVASPLAVVRNHDTPASSRFEVDEVMIHPVAGAPAKSAPDRNLGREQTLRLLVG